MLTKTILAGKNVEVKFRMPPIDDVVELNLCGDFNNWQTAGAPLVQEADGTWVATLVLEAGKRYRFRYLDNQGRWHNDREADAHVPNDFGSEDSIVDLTALGKKAPHHAPKGSPKKKAATKKAVSKKRPGKSR
jgi:1,4-alpha-glucan branching enzyme